MVSATLLDLATLEQRLLLPDQEVTMGQGIMPARRAACRAAVIGCVLLAASAAGHAAELVSGHYALPQGEAKVTATLAVSSGGPERTLDVAMTPLRGSTPVTEYETELSKQLHLIAVSADLRDFVHEHGDAPAPDGHSG